MRTTAFAIVALLASGCALAPGMKMDEGAAVARGRAATGDPEFHVVPVTPDVVGRLAVETWQQSPLLPDPLGDQVATYQYTVAPHDVIQVVVWDHPELTAPTGQFRSPEENGNVVKADGTVYYPHVGVVHVAGKTLEEVRKILTDKLARFITAPQLDVRVVGFRGRKVQVTGEVVAPTTIPITDLPLRVQDAIALARGFTPDADWSNVLLSRDGKTYRLNLQALYENGVVSQNWLLKDGDVVNIGDRNRNKVFILGEVRAPHSQVMLKGRMTLAEALSDATGGWDPSFANTGRIYVIRGDYRAPDIYRLNAESPDALLLAAQFQLRPRDVVFVSTYELARFNRVMSQIMPTIVSLWQLYDIANRTAGSIRAGSFGSNTVTTP